ncbi:hypothetical protein CCR97_08275 [Rhodoplanes elegans]|uniref:Uncharacterized protein n=1 Tax=Rhodoplanes elegans TaxID=29408 RepID=A0A327KT35_9BRAD|nr:hypothetical protein [Rhodoplanes elegans]MBK5958115.1 hypothetical protein [Rhodoplanes elegans]MBK5958207.1 hypothetical protein [Rhodoplanes elegans]RAI41989.1 hypothetical protein CH338_01415 [Rhodoplanes elegans]
MALSAKIEALDRDVELIIQSDLSPAARSRVLAQFAREQIGIASEQNRRALGSVPPFTTFVDGSESAALDRVRPDGVISVEYELFVDVLRFIADELVKTSPKLTGRYSKSHILMADGDEIELTDDLPDAAEFAFVSTMPYSRKLEKGLSRQAPDGIYEVLAAKAKRRFSNIATIRFGFRSVLGASALNTWAGRTRMRPNRTNKQSARAFGDWLRRQPAIVVTFRNR